MKPVPLIPVFALLWLLPSILCVAGCTKQKSSNTLPISSTTPPAAPAPVADSGMRYLALGDSYTIGQGVHENARFPAQTVALLRQEGFALKNPEYIAVTGWTTASHASAILRQMPQGPYDIVTLLIGVNDQYQHMDTGGYRTRFTGLLKKSVELAGNRPAKVFVLSIPDYSATPFVQEADKPRVSEQIDWFNAINKQITLQNKIAYIDITPSTREAKTDPTLVADDGLHPSGTAYKIWAEMLAPLIKQAL
jgi:lysophospholipase L1-like esterase